MKRILLIVFTTTVIISCREKSQDLITFTQNTSDYPIIVERDKYRENIYVIRVFFQCEIDKNNLHGSVGITPTGICRKKDNWLWQAAFIPYDNIDRLVKCNNNIELSYFTSIDVVFGAVFFIDIENKNYRYIAQDIKRLQSSKQDTIQIGTIEKIKNSNPVFLTEFLKIDSVDLTLVYNDNFHYLSVPIEMK